MQQIVIVYPTELIHMHFYLNLDWLIQFYFPFHLIIKSGCALQQYPEMGRSSPASD